MIELYDAAIGYPDRLVASHLNFRLEKGMITVILGRNGAGKTTLLKSLLGFIPLRQGRIEIEGRNLESLRSKERARLCAYVRQVNTVPCMKAGQLVLHGRFCWGGWPRFYTLKDRRLARQAMEHLQITDLWNRYMDTLSGGECQKVQVAMAITQDTPYVFFDEPASFLDIPSQDELTQYMLQLKEAGKGILVVEHNLSHALEYADKLLVLDKGELCFEGSVDELIASGLLEKIFGSIMRPVFMDGKTRYVRIQPKYKRDLYSDPFFSK